MIVRLHIYKRRTVENTLDFIDNIIEGMLFTIQRIQIDREREFFVEKVKKTNAIRYQTSA